jgi:signal transduction histidine kinase/DNA-binding NarL/FixJ family response regulator
MARVLVVDDEPNVRRSFVMFLRHGGHDVEAVGDSEHALAKLEESSFDVVLSDIVLRHDDGMSLLRHVSERWPEIQVVLVTGQPSIDTAALAVRDGAFAYLRKPISGPALLEVVNGAAQVKTLRDENRRLGDEFRATQEELARLKAHQAAHAEGKAEKFEVAETRALHVADNFPGVMYQLRLEDSGFLTFTFLGVGCKELLRLDPEEVTFDSHLLLDCIHHDDRDAFDDSLEESARTGSRWRWEGRLAPPGGEILWIQIHSNPQRQDDGTVIWDGVMIDVSERKRLQAELMLADRLASVGSLVQGLVHEVNNPLTVVLANLELLSSRVSMLENSEDLPTLTAETLTQVERIREVLSALSSFSPDDAELTLIDVQKVIDDVLKLAENELRHRAPVVREYIDTPLVLASRALLSQLMLNLVLNAAQSIPEGQFDQNEIRIAVSRHTEGGLTIAITDTGQGMTPELQRRAFDPFMGAQAAGSGLGLFICQSIVKQMGGTLDVNSRSGRGTTFQIYLPSTREDPVADSEISGDFPRPTLVQRARVLVIDDEAGIRRALVRALAEHEVEVAASGRDGLAMAIHGNYDIIFCDLMMPEMTGMEVFDRVRREAPEIAERMVFITGGAFTKRARNFLEAAPNPRVKKPFDLLEIRAVMADLLPD